MKTIKKQHSSERELISSGANCLKDRAYNFNSINTTIDKRNRFPLFIKAFCKLPF